MAEHTRKEGGEAAQDGGATQDGGGATKSPGAEECTLCGGAFEHGAAQITYGGCAHRAHLACEARSRPQAMADFALRPAEQEAQFAHCAQCEPRGALPPPAGRGAAGGVSTLETLQEIRTQQLRRLGDEFSDGVQARRDYYTELLSEVEGTPKHDRRPDAKQLERLFGTRNALDDPAAVIDVLLLQSSEINADRLRTARVSFADLYARYNVRSLLELGQLGFRTEKHLRAAPELYSLHDLLAYYQCSWRDLREHLGLTAASLCALQFDRFDLAVLDLDMDELFKSAPDGLGATRSHMATLCQDPYTLERRLSFADCVMLGLDAALLRDRLSVTRTAHVTAFGWDPDAVRLLLGTHACVDDTDPNGQRLLRRLLPPAPKPRAPAPRRAAAPPPQPRMRWADEAAPRAAHRPPPPPAAAPYYDDDDDDERPPPRARHEVEIPHNLLFSQWPSNPRD